MANCIAHERCPACTKKGRDRHGDNLGIYDDGSKYCFSCHYLLPNLEFVDNEDRNLRPEEKQRHLEIVSLSLPKDSTPVIESTRGLDWILQYGLTNKEIVDNLILFSESGIDLIKKKEHVSPLVIFPIYGNPDELLMWHGRNLSYDGIGTKWVIKGKTGSVVHGIFPDMFKLGVSKSSCCVCEDLLSAIKLGRIIPTYPLFGKNINELLLKYLSSNFNELLIYLDYDAIDTAYTLQKKVSPYFDQVRVIISELDPKLYETMELKEIIN